MPIKFIIIILVLWVLAVLFATDTFAKRPDTEIFKAVSEKKQVYSDEFETVKRAITKKSWKVDGQVTVDKLLK